MIRSPGTTHLATWLALALGFSPVIADLGREYWENPAARLAVIAALALGMASAHEHTTSRRRPAAGITAIALGLALEMLGVAGHTWLLGRAGLAVAVIGIAALQGRPSLRAALLALAAVPVPITVFNWASPEFETALARIASLPHRWLGLDVQVVGGLLRSDGAWVQLLAIDNGVPLAVAAVAVAWLSALWRDVSPGRAALEALGAAALAIAIQPLLIAVAGALLVGVGAGAARTWLDWAGISLALGALAVLEKRRPGAIRAAPRPERSD